MHELRVLNGLHQGAALPLIGDHWLIGSDEQHDLLLQDPGIARRHCRLLRDNEHWRLEVEDGSLLDEHGNPCDSLPNLTQLQTFQLGAVTLSIMPSSATWPAPLETPAPKATSAAHEPHEASAAVAPKRPALPKRFVVAGLVVTLAGSAWALSSPSPVVEPPPGQAQAQPRLVLSASSTVQKLRTMLRERDLLDAVKVASTAEGVEMTGVLPAEKLALYRRMLDRFAQQQNSAVAVLDRVRPFCPTLPFKIVQIASGKSAHVVLSDNRRLFLGDEVDGLRLTKIDKNHVEFDGDEHFEVKW